MKIIKNNKNETLIVQNSKFIAYIYKINNLEEINNILKEKKEEYKDANHVCYAYILNNYQKYSDDNEPSSTAGKPLLTLLQKENLNYVLGIVVRYFGGIKLGRNGLVHAYTNSLKQVIDENIKELEEGYHILITTTYENIDNIHYLLRNSQIIKEDFKENIQIEVKIKEDVLKTLPHFTYIIIQKIFF